jgi:DNA-binding NtrC family response regulator
VRELGNSIERAVVMCPRPVIGVSDLGLEPSRLGVLAAVRDPDGAREAGDAAASASGGGKGSSVSPGGAGGPGGDEIRVAPGLTLAQAERCYARAILERHGGNQSAAARALGIGRNKLARLLRDDEPEA